MMALKELLAAEYAKNICCRQFGLCRLCERIALRWPSKRWGQNGCCRPASCANVYIGFGRSLPQVPFINMALRRASAASGSWRYEAWAETILR